MIFFFVKSPVGASFATLSAQGGAGYGTVIEEFYYGNIDPQSRNTKKNPTVQKEMAVLSEAEERLTNTLTDEPKKWFLDFANAWGVINGESNLDSFMMGFRLGAGFAYDAFVATETPFDDL